MPDDPTPATSGDARTGQGAPPGVPHLRSLIARTVVESAPGAPLQVERVELTEEAKRGLNTWLTELPPAPIPPQAPPP